MNKSIRIMALLTAQSFSILLLGLNAFAHFPQVLADILACTASTFVGWTVAELMFWDTEGELRTFAFLKAQYRINDSLAQEKEERIEDFYKNHSSGNN
jgi:hypothetical protein